MSDYSYPMLLQVFTPMHVLLHIHVLTCVNVPITLGHMTTGHKVFHAILSIILLPISV